MTKRSNTPQHEVAIEGVSADGAKVNGIYYGAETLVCALAQELYGYRARSAVSETGPLLPGLKAALEIAEKYLRVNDAIQFLRNDIKDRILKEESAPSAALPSDGPGLLATRMSKLVERLRHEASLRAHYGDPILEEAADEIERLLAQLPEGVARQDVLNEVAAWYEKTGFYMDEDDVAKAIRTL